MKHINFEDGTPLFTEQELLDAMELVSDCITRVIKEGKYDSEEWYEYLLKRNESLCYPEEILRHINYCITRTVNALNNE